MEKITETSVRLQALLDALPDPVVLVERGGAVMTSNAAWGELLLEASSAVAPHSFDADSPWLRQLAAMFTGAAEDHDAVAEGLQAVAVGERPRFDFDYVYTRSGEDRCLSLTISRFRVGESNEGSVLIQARRTTEPLLRRELESELRELSERHRCFMIATTEGVCLTEDGRILDVNPAALQLFGREEEEIIGLPALDLVPPEDREAAIQRFYTNELGFSEMKLLRGDGTWFHAEIWASQVPHHGRMIRGSAIRDVTQRRLAEQALRESEERFRLLSDMSSESVVLTDGGVLIDVNAATSELLGYTKEELVGRVVLDVIAPECHEDVLQSIITQREYPYEIYAVHKDGTKIPMLARGRSVPHRGRMIRGTTIRDIRLQRQMDEALRQRVAQEAELAAQAAMLAELSTPLIPIDESTVVMPLIGAIDTQRAVRVVEALLSGVERSGASIAILDVTGVPTLDSHVADTLVRAARAVRLIGAEVVLTGIRPEVARTLITMGVDLSDIPTRGTLQSGIAYAMAV